MQKKNKERIVREAIRVFSDTIPEVAPSTKIFLYSFQAKHLYITVIPPFRVSSNDKEALRINNFLSS